MKLNKKRIRDYFNGSGSKEDSRYMEELFRNKDVEDQLRDFMLQQWNDSFETDLGESKDLNHILERLYTKVEYEQKPNIAIRIWKAYARIAAMLLLPLGVIYIMYTQFTGKEPYNEVSSLSISAPFGSKIQFTLPDGSTGWLNSGSTIRYPAQFGKTRDVQLMGEAWFDVKKDLQRPFNVSVSEVNISVLGTQFNVNAYKGEKIDVVLESGKVALKRKNSKEEFEMVPKERVVIDLENNKVSKTSVETNKYSGWKDGKLVFRNDTMDEVALRLSRWYNIEVEVDNPDNKDFRLRATFEDEDIDEVLRLLKMSFPIDYEIDPRKKGEDDHFYKRKVFITMR